MTRPARRAYDPRRQLPFPNLHARPPVRQLAPFLAALAASIAATPVRAQYADLTTWTTAGDAFATPSTLSLTSRTTDSASCPSTTMYYCSTAYSTPFRTSGGVLSFDYQFNVASRHLPGIIGTMFALGEASNPFGFVQWASVDLGHIPAPGTTTGRVRATRMLDAGDWVFRVMILKGRSGQNDGSLTISNVTLPPAPPTVAPEPATVVLTASGLLALGAVRARRRRAR